MKEMKIGYILTIITGLASVCACQSELQPEESIAKHELTVKASLPGTDITRSEISFGNSDLNTRAQITYGNQDHNKEIFLWNYEDEINVFNLSKLSECPEGIPLFANTINGHYADFTPDLTEEQYEDRYNKFRVEKGDIIFVSYNATTRAYSANESLSGLDLFKIEINHKPQLIFDNPTDESMSYMASSSVKMYDIVTAVNNDEVPDIHFKHLSAIMRVTLHIESDSEEVEDTKGEFWLKELKFEYPGTESFFNNAIYFSVNSESQDNGGLTVYSNLDGSDTYTDYVKSDINNYTAAPTETGTFLKRGQSYDLYQTCVPQIENNAKGKQLIITLQKRLGSSTSKEYSMTLEGFDVPIEAGKRYWFNITAFDDEDGTGKLMLTSDWLKQQEQNQGSGEETSSGDE